MTAAALARLHAACFTTPRPWTETEFAALLSDTGTVLVDDAQGFALGRVIAGEAELLTLAVAPAARNRGIGRDLLRRFLIRAFGQGAATAFLEVAADNDAALALYRAAGFAQVGQRRGYYTAPGQRPVDALVLSRSLQDPLEI